MPLIEDNEHDSFANIPPFPNSVPTAPLLRISLERLLVGDPDEQDRLWTACTDLGFFYLDLRTTSSSQTTTPTLDGSAILSSVDSLFSVGESLFALPLDEKRRYDHSSLGSYFGYKGLGDAVVDAAGSRDRNEFYNAAKDQVLGVRSVDSHPDLKYPPFLEAHQPLLKGYITRCHALVTFLLSLLGGRLQLPPGKLEGLHRIEAVSGDQVRWVRAPPQPVGDQRTALGAHTDFGSVTVLFNRVGGLQVRLPRGIEAIEATEPVEEGDTVLTGEEGGEQWTYVRPLPGHAVINLGDAMVKFSAGVLRSNIHRVISPPGRQAGCTRYSLVYFNRPEDEVLLEALEESPMIKERMAGKEKEVAMNSKDWILRRALGSRKGVDGWKESRGTEDSRATA